VPGFGRSSRGAVRGTVETRGGRPCPPSTVLLVGYGARGPRGAPPPGGGGGAAPRLRGRRAAPGVVTPNVAAAEARARARARAAAAPAAALRAAAPAAAAARAAVRALGRGERLREVPRLRELNEPARGTRRVRLVRGEGRGVST
jgi:hypothetical protein